MTKAPKKKKKLAKARKTRDREEMRLRQEVVATALAMSRSGLSPGSSGNVSARFADGMLITPTGIAYADIKARDIVFVAGDGKVPGKQKKPSSEWQFHLAAYKARRDMGAVVHTHSLHAVVLACAGRSIPAFHYMVAISGGIDIPVLPYATFGTEKLAQNVGRGLADRQACLMAHHGAIAIGKTLRDALALAHEVEILAEQYTKVLAIGPPAVISEEEMRVVLDKFKSYGQQA
ncbi:MAG: L-fuculose-phosphate aldolase [Hyphomicrobium sp.]|uniref:L-fuculose-phosphate aldolase n=1 Tax=Hyphomicrobium sp. TaxID=82 RepID=UPI003D0AB998